MLTPSNSTGRYAQRNLLRRVFLRPLGRFLLNLLADLTIEGWDNLPESGPLLVVANHFSAYDPVPFLFLMPWGVEYLGGFQTPNAPRGTAWMARLWGYLKVHRGTGARDALKAALVILEQGAVVGIFPEGNSGAQVLRPPRAGVAFLAALSGAPILPVGLDGWPDLFPPWPGGKRAPVTIRIGEVLGPFEVTARGRERRQQLDAITSEVMQAIADLLPPERRGYLSGDPALRAEALAAGEWIWDATPE